MRTWILAAFVTLLMAFSTTAHAGNGDQVCHRGAGYIGGMWVEVWETDGSIYKLYGGDCTPRWPGIRSMRAPEGWAIYYKRESSYSTLRACHNLYRTTGWCGVYEDIDIMSVKPM